MRWCLVMGVLVLTGGVGACVVPQPLEQINEDGGPNQGFGIDVSNTRPSLLTTLTLAQGDAQDFVITIRDAEREVVAVRLFIHPNYKSLIIPERRSTEDPGLKSVAFTVTGLCDEKVNYKLGAYILEVYASDRGFVDTGPDLRLGKPGAQRSNELWNLNCIERVTVDGGI